MIDVGSIVLMSMLAQNFSLPLYRFAEPKNMAVDSSVKQNLKCVTLKWHSTGWNEAVVPILFSVYKNILKTIQFKIKYDAKYNEIVLHLLTHCNITIHWYTAVCCRWANPARIQICCNKVRIWMVTWYLFSNTITSTLHREDQETLCIQHN